MSQNLIVFSMYEHLRACVFSVLKLHGRILMVTKFVIYWHTKKVAKISFLGDL